MKPACDGTLALHGLGDAIRQAREAAVGEQAQASLLQRVEQLRRSALA